MAKEVDQESMYWAALSDERLGNAALLDAIEDYPNMEGYSAPMYEIPSAAPVGYLELAVDTASRKACGLCSQLGDPEGDAERIVWVEGCFNADDAARKICNELVAKNLI
jgi:hypothetical protein